MKTVASYIWYVQCSILCVHYAKPWPDSDIIPCCHRSVHAFTARYDSTLLGHVFYIEGVFAWDIITIVRFIYCYKSRIIDSHIYNLCSCIAAPAEVDHRIHQSCTFFHWQYNLHWIFDLKQEMQQIYYINSTSLISK